MKQDILIFSNRIDLTGAANTSLAEHDISAIIASDMRTALSVLQTRTPAFLWLDLDTDAARSFLSEIMDRHLNPPPYIILTSSFSNSADRAGMLNQGADACVELPVDLREILAILNAVLRREGRIKFVHTGALMPCIEYKELFIDPLRRQVKMRGQIVCLTPKEFELLHLLANSPGIAFSKEQIYSHIWKVDSNLGLSAVSDHISSLRQKLGLHPKDSEYIQTIFKVGYRFAEFT
jgi:DNA-binding response OmpR family regulator